MKLVYDIETDGLEANVIWCLVAHNISTGQTYKYSDHDDSLASIESGVQLLANAEVLIGHNIIGYDNLVIQKLYGVDLNNTVKCFDTWIMSQTLRFKRDHKHGLAGWGLKLQNHKIDFDDWSQYSREMLRYCVQDVMLNLEVYQYLLEDFKQINKYYPMIRQGLKIEHDTAVFNATVKSQGWNFDRDKANKNLKSMQGKMDKIERELEPQLGTYTVYIDKEPRLPKYKKNGDYHAVTANHLSELLGVTVKQEDIHVWPAGKTYQRTKQEQIKLGQVDLVKDWLLNEKGWQPDDWTMKKDGFKWVKKSPKFTDTSLSKLGDIGEMISDYYTLRNRTATIIGWLDQVVEGRLHGNMWTIGTPTFRARHEVIVNLPGVQSDYGKEIRELLVADEGDVIVGADSAGNQLRALAHYVGNDDFTHEIIHGDQHSRNAEILGCSRSLAKNYLYAYLFGAGPAKLGQTLSGKPDANLGKQSAEKFGKGIKGLQELRDKIQGQWKQTMYKQNVGWFPGLDGRPVFAGSEHQCLNYLLQSAEAITCKAAISYQMDKIKEEGLRAKPRIFYHDEAAWSVHPDDAKRVGEILQESFKVAPQQFGVECMDGGDYVIGESYAEVH